MQCRKVTKAVCSNATNNRRRTAQAIVILLTIKTCKNSTNHLSKPLDCWPACQYYCLIHFQIFPRSVLFYFRIIKLWKTGWRDIASADVRPRDLSSFSPMEELVTKSLFIQLSTTNMEGKGERGDSPGNPKNEIKKIMFYPLSPTRAKILAQGFSKVLPQHFQP